MKFILDGLSYQYRGSDRQALAGVSLSFDSETITGLAGSNGSGKTTLIRILLGQLSEYQGLCSIDGVPLNDTQGNVASRFRIGFSPDTPILDETLTGREMLLLAGELRGLTPAGIEEEIALFRRTLIIDEWLGTQQCRTYSAGMRRKVSVALAFLGPVAFVILDEPVNGLDPLSLAGLRELCGEKLRRGCGSLISSHILDFVEKTSGQVILLKQGVCRYSGPLDRMYQEFPGTTGLESVYLGLFAAGKKTV